MQRHRQFRCRHGHAGDLVRLGQDFLHERHAGGDGLAAAAHGLDVHRLQAAGEALFLHQAADLVHLAAQTEDDDVGKVGVAGVAGEGAAEQTQRLVLGHAAAGLVGQRDDAIDVGEIGQRIVAGERVAAEHVGDDAGDVGRTVHAGQDADVVARGDLAVGAADALEGGGGFDEIGWAGIDAVGVILGEIAHLAVVDVHVLARCDGGGGETDDLAVAADRFARGDGSDRDLVAGGNALGRADVIADRRAGQQGGAGDHDAVLGVQANDGRRGHGGFLRLDCRLLTASGR